MNTVIKNLGECKTWSPLLNIFPSNKSFFVSDELRVRYNCYMDNEFFENRNNIQSFEAAGPREKIYFDPAKISCAIVTCGGLSPGLNNVIRAIVMESYYRYGVRSILGIRYGYSGLNSKINVPIELTPQLVRDIHMQGGTILGSSRGGTEDMEMMVDRLEELGIGILYAIGGDGTMKGAHKIAEIIQKHGSSISIIGVPKTIDNDVSYIQRTFGFESAVSRAVDAIYSAHIEAEGAQNGIGLVKLMGRYSGFIAANSALAMNDVNFLLVPEVDFDLYGKNGFLYHLEERLKRRGHAVICVAEGAGQNLLAGANEHMEYDASGNAVLEDIGLYLKDKIKEYFNSMKIKINLKYIDPSYMIRSTPANSNDAIFCAMLGQFAVHAGMAGKTDMIIGIWNNVYTHVPIELVISERKQIDPNSRFWYNVMAATGQPVDMTSK